MRPDTHFEIEFATREAGALAKARLHDSAEVLAFVEEKLRPGSELLVACLGDDVDYGNLILDFDALGEVSLRALEHSGFAVHQSPENRRCRLWSTGFRRKSAYRAFNGLKNECGRDAAVGHNLPVANAC